MNQLLQHLLLVWKEVTTKCKKSIAFQNLIVDCILLLLLVLLLTNVYTGFFYSQIIFTLGTYIYVCIYICVYIYIYIYIYLFIYLTIKTHFLQISNFVQLKVVGNYVECNLCDKCLLKFSNCLPLHFSIAVYDLGGGTFDISVLEIQKGVFEVS